MKLFNSIALIIVSLAGQALARDMVDLGQTLAYWDSNKVLLPSGSTSYYNWSSIGWNTLNFTDPNDAKYSGVFYINNNVNAGSYVTGYAGGRCMYNSIFLSLSLGERF